MLMMTPAQDADLAVAQQAVEDASDSLRQHVLPGARQLLGLVPGAGAVLDALWRRFEVQWYSEWLTLQSSKAQGAAPSKRCVPRLPGLHLYTRCARSGCQFDGMYSGDVICRR